MGIMFGMYAAYADIVIGPIVWWRLSAKRLGLNPRTNKLGSITLTAFFAAALMWVLWGEQAPDHLPNLEDVSDDGSIVLAGEHFQGESLLYRIDTATGVASRLSTMARGFNSFGSLSPDGKLIVFAHSDDEKNYAVMVTDLFGNNTHPLLSEHGNDSWPRFSADGRTIYFIRTEGSGFDLFASSLDGKNVTQITHQHYTFKLGPYLQSAPVVSSDGKQMLFTTEEMLQLCSLSSANQQPSNLLFPFPGSPSQRIYVSAYFSADNKEVIFMAASSEKNGYGYDVYRLDLASRQIQKLSKDNGYSTDFRLSVGGKKAVFLKWKLSYFQKLPRSFQLQLMDIPTGRITPVKITGLPK